MDIHGMIVMLVIWRVEQVISHLAVQRCLYAYFTGAPMEEQNWQSACINVVEVSDSWITWAAHNDIHAWYLSHTSIERASLKNKVGGSLRSSTSIPPRRATWIGDSIPEHGQEIPYLNMDMHTVVELRPGAFDCQVRSEPLDLLWMVDVFVSPLEAYVFILSNKRVFGMWNAWLLCRMDKFFGLGKYVLYYCHLYIYIGIGFDY